MLLLRLLEKLKRVTPHGDGGAHGGSNGGAFLKVTIGVLTTLVAAGIVGGVSAVQRLSTVEANYESLARDMVELKVDVKILLQRVPPQ